MVDDEVPVGAGVSVEFELIVVNARGVFTIAKQDHPDLKSRS